VSIVVHNFADLRATRDYRAAALTQQSLLDNLQHGINATVQDFFFHQTEARKKQLGVQEKTKPAAPSATPTIVAPMTPAPSASKKDTAPTQAALTTPAPSARKKDTTSASKKDATATPKKDAEKSAATDQFHLF
jgi:hypothetical protein